ncbi:hypothetical protein YTPLAS18_27140 [Nitrospira sp.]|nr:hypothetical protein YTPLAS18_27140 [Nitrospira sp.]
MDSVSTPLQQLVDVLHQEIAQLHQLARVAAEERTALRQLAMPSFESVNQRRMQTLELLQVLETRRQTILADLAHQWGIPDRSLTLAAVVERVGRDMSATLSGQQREMDRLVDAVRQLMVVNRLAMTKLVDFIQQTLASACPAAGQETLYSGTGTKRSVRPSGRVLAQRG